MLGVQRKQREGGTTMTDFAECDECHGTLRGDRVIQVFYADWGGEIYPPRYAHAWHFQNQEETT